jgi:hypothetical protein
MTVKFYVIASQFIGSAGESPVKKFNYKWIKIYEY